MWLTIVLLKYARPFLKKDVMWIGVYVALKYVYTLHHWWCFFFPDVKATSSIKLSADNKPAFARLFLFFFKVRLCKVHLLSLGLSFPGLWYIYLQNQQKRAPDLH